MFSRRNPVIHAAKAGDQVWDLLDFLNSLLTQPARTNRLEMRQLHTMRFGIRSLLLAAAAVAAVAVMCALFVAARNKFYADRRQVHSVLAAVDGISIISLHGHIDVTEEIDSTSISVDVHPDSIIQLEGLGHYDDTGSFYVSRIGKWRFSASGRRHMGAYIAATGDPVESEYSGGCMVLGPGSPYSELIPFEVNTLQDVVDHYEDFVDLFETWPRESKPGTVKLEDGSTQHYYVVEEPLSPK